MMKWRLGTKLWKEVVENYGDFQEGKTYKDCKRSKKVHNEAMVLPSEESGNKYAILNVALNTGNFPVGFWKTWWHLADKKF